MNTLIAIFSDREMAENAITELETQGYNPKDISLIMRSKDGERIEHKIGTNVTDSAATGVATGGLLGGVAGLLIGVGTVTIPGVGALLFAGPLAAALGIGGAAASTISGAVTGAVAGGLVGSLVGLGIPEKEAKHYESRIRDGGILLAIPSIEGEESKIRSILGNYHADMVRVINTSPKEPLANKSNYQVRDNYDRNNDQYGEVESNPAYYSDVRPLPKQPLEYSENHDNHLTRLTEKIKDWFR